MDIQADIIEDRYMTMAVEGSLIIKGDMIYSSVFYRMENAVANMMEDLSEPFDKDEDEIRAAISGVQDEEGIVLDELQKKSVELCVKNGVFILTGGPGTGKTTTINTMIRYFEREGLEVELAAPTGRAAKRMSEMTGHSAKTIHRMLEFSGLAEDTDLQTGSNAPFQRNRENPLEQDVFIIDEASMIDITLMYHLLLAIPPDARLILVGDIDQLPSVGPGSVLKDLISSNHFPVVELKRIFRQAGESDIVVNAHKIRDGEPIVLDNKSRDFFYIQRYSTEDIMSTTLELTSRKIPGYVHANPYDIQVLTPTKKGELGVEGLNKRLREALNPESESKHEKLFGETIFREGDKVMQNRNNYTLEWEIRDRFGVAVEKGKGVFNGDIGVVRSVNDFAKTLLVEYDEKRICEYSYSGLGELEPAFAMTVHKSQGSEYPAVIMPLFSGPEALLNRNLLYTAVTRAKDCVVMVGDANVFYRMIANDKQFLRYTGLKIRIEEVLSKRGELI